MDLSQVTLTQMRYAVAIAETGGFRQAAERSFVSQSGLSMQIRKLEELLGVQLFDRSRRPVLATHEGEAALVQMRTILRETERLGQVVADQGEPAGPYRLGVIPSLASSVLPLFLRAFVERYPRVELTIEELMTHDILARLQEDTLDAGVAATPLDTPGMTEVPLGYEPFLAYLPPGDALLDKDMVEDADLQQCELWIMPEGHCFRSQVLSLCRAGHRGQHANVNFESGSFETLTRLVDDGLGATVLPALVVNRLPPSRRSAQVRPLGPTPPMREIGLVTSRSDLRRRINDALAQLVRERLADALGPVPRDGRVLDPLAS